MSPFQSLRWRIQFWQFCLLAVTVVLLLVGFYFYEKRSRMERVDMQLSVPESALIASHIILPQAEARARRTGGRLANWQGPDMTNPSGHRPEPPPGESPRRSGGNFRSENDRDQIWPPEGDRHEIRLLDQYGLYAKVWNLRGQAVFEHGSREVAELEMPDSRVYLQGRNYRWNGPHRELVFMGHHGGVAIIGRSAVLMDEELANFAWMLAGGGFGILGLAFWLGWMSSRRVIQPVTKISREARRIAEGDLKGRISETDTDDEFNELVRVLNATFARLADSLEQQIKFSLDASHELRTPLTIILFECQWSLEKTRSADEYAATIALCEKTARHMRSLIEALLELSRADANANALRRTTLPVQTVFEEARGLLEGLADRQQIELQFAATEVMVSVDLQKIKQVIINLVNNAIEHSPPGGSVRVESQSEGGKVAIKVIDHGEGISPEDQERIFDRFYQVDKPHVRMNGGSGLGLAISLVIVRAHGGDLRVASVPGEGSCFTVLLPQET